MLGGIEGRRRRGRQGEMAGGIKVAVVDVGVQLEHEDLVDNLETGYDAVDNEFQELRPQQIAFNY